jgi:anhydro-N-acetylmuramic acid kinase
MNSAEIFSTDTGPGNTMMDAFTQKHFTGKHFDKDAAIALQGKLNQNLLDALKENEFFQKPFPKTTGPELFNLDYLQQAKEKSATAGINIEDTMATLNKFSADTIIDAVLKSTDKNKSYNVYSSGGGMHNPLLMQYLKDGLPDFTFSTTAALNIDPDAKEAVLFAVLANECICGNGSYLQTGIDGIPVVSMGKISFPS